MKPTIILVHGAYADSSSWNRVIAPLAAEGHRVIAWANPLRSVATDAAALVYVAGFALTPGESAGDASSLAPGSTLAERSNASPSRPVAWTPTSHPTSSTISSPPTCRRTRAR